MNGIGGGDADECPKRERGERRFHVRLALAPAPPFL